MKRAITLAFLLTLGATVGVAWAQTYSVINIIGNMYESDNDPAVVGFPPSDPGDVLAALGFVDNISEPLTWSTADYEYTFVFSDLVSEGQFDIGNGQIRMNYTGGTVDIIAQPYADPGYTVPFYGIDPPEAGAIASFSDGEVYLHGTFTGFTMTYDTTNFSGSFQGTIVFELGTHFSELGQELANPDGLTIAGVIGTQADPTIPQGYDLEVDGSIYYDPTIPNEERSWGSVKDLYR